ncbi:hypothetical protein CAEBREN_19053 [Caenorhabditis brenneri]|uniref:Uncharacterized protein n=1 Tax=Caenorhabditis brenneri TaxID=135651 RepID=G0MY72_CAEBE|nr:hypothetical protein CAEBREN_19053 [Caenorhabditis brenneri]
MEHDEPELNMDRDLLVKYMEAFIAVHEWCEHYSQLIEAQLDKLEYFENVESSLKIIILVGTRIHTPSGRHECNAAVEIFKELAENWFEIIGE